MLACYAIDWYVVVVGVVREIACLYWEGAAGWPVYLPDHVLQHRETKIHDTQILVDTV